MTLTEKTLVQSKPTTKAVIYTASSKTIIKNIIITNNSASDNTVTIWVDTDGSSSNDENLIHSAATITTKATIDRNIFIVLEIGGTITAEGTGSSITVSGAQLS